MCIESARPRENNQGNTSGGGGGGGGGGVGGEGVRNKVRRGNSILLIPLPSSRALELDHQYKVWVNQPPLTLGQINAYACMQCSTSGSIQGPWWTKRVTLLQISKMNVICLLTLTRLLSNSTCMAMNIYLWRTSNPYEYTVHACMDGPLKQSFFFFSL